MKRRHCRTMATITAFFLLFRAACQAAVVIDSFDTTQNASIAIGDRNTADGPDIIGGERDFVTFLPMSVNDAAPHQLQITSLGGGGGDIYYDGDDNDPSSSSFGGMGSIDLTEGGVNDRFRFNFTSASNVPATLTIDVKNFGVGAGLHFNLPQSPGILDVPFASFGSSAVFHTVGFIGLHFEIHGPGTFTIDGITATSVPEPAAMPLALTAALGIGWYRRRCR